MTPLYITDAAGIRHQATQADIDDLQASFSRLFDFHQRVMDALAGCGRTAEMGRFSGLRVGGRSRTTLIVEAFAGCITRNHGA